MSGEEVDQELVELRETRSKLLGKAIELRKKMADFENTQGKNSAWTAKDFLPPRNEFHDLFTRNDDDVHFVDKKCVAVSSFMMGVKFNMVDKKWLSEKKYLYTANVKSKVLEFFLEVTVDSKIADKKPEVLGIVCHFVNVRKCYSLEITPWVHRFTEANDTNNLFSAISDYSEHNVTRTKVLRKYQEYDRVSAQECTEDDGGILIFIHAKNNRDSVYFEIRWALRFVESLWRIDNYFIIQPISAGDEFLKENNQLLQRFCKYRIKKDDLQDLWDKLCSAVEQDEASESPSGTIAS